MKRYILLSLVLLCEIISQAQDAPRWLRYLALSPDGQKIAFTYKGDLYTIYHDKKGGENAWRKHHTSSIARDIWIFDKSTGEHKMITTFKGEDRNPVFSADEKSIYYLSEESGSFNCSRL